MLKVGITGGLASGKSSFCKVWQDLGATVVFADDLAKSLMQNNESLKSSIRKVFGSASYDENGQLNRPYLAEAAFQAGRVEELNALVHPVVAEASQKLANKADNNRAPIFLYEAALLLKNGRPAWLDKVIWVQSEKSQQIKRAVKRSNIATIEAEKRLHYQPKLELVKPYIDYLIYNDRDIESLHEQAAQLYHKLVSPVK
jgi:dephospho-CoA kinase